jgi:drug/metabolite transporter (DMT)-like permease
MTPVLIAIVVGAALMHASWNAILRGNKDRLRSIVLMNMISATVALPFAFMLSTVVPASWPYLGVSLFLQIGYCLFLERAYREGELSQAYPIIRGTSPLLVALGAAIVVGERLTVLTTAGVSIVSVGIVALACERTRPTAKLTLAAVATGAFIAAFTVTDGVGARISGHPLSYASWLFFLQGVAMPCVYAVLRGKFIVIARDPESLKAVAGGILSMLAYGAIIVALTLSPMGQVSALREVSIVFAAIIGVVFLKEALTLRRAGATLMIAIGAIVLSAGH